MNNQIGKVGNQINNRIITLKALTKPFWNLDTKIFLLLYKPTWNVFCFFLRDKNYLLVFSYNGNTENLKAQPTTQKRKYTKCMDGRKQNFYHDNT